MTSVRPATDAEREALMAVEARRINALIAADTETLNQIFHESLIHVHGPGLVHNKAQLLEHVATRRAYQEINRGELTVRVVGEIAILVGPITNKLMNPDGSTRIQQGTVTQVLLRGEDNHWRFLSFQLTPLGEQVWGKLESEREPAADATGGESAADNGGAS